MKSAVSQNRNGIRGVSGCRKRAARLSVTSCPPHYRKVGNSLQRGGQLFFHLFAFGGES